ncbi:type II toxin-antitoxin system YoeB family toxin [Nocardioides albidus]|uniref:Type II toxin-antitoxin system YoeB family toxin n=1 Tax=Nocardioides albidus TaxID=1517589 RepID=A0A5C4VS32_9ACTN|nr:type II toxin-antitoxin system YoeB family toxin [Nocardioides albidus]
MWWQQQDRKLINDEHRLIHKTVDDEVRIAACRYHYEG